jgi:hypothetical protein
MGPVHIKRSKNGAPATYFSITAFNPENDKLIKRGTILRVPLATHHDLHGTVFHSTRKWFITQCERTGVPEHFTASLVGHQSARSENKLTYGLYSAGISDTQKRDIIDQIRLPQDLLL